tara:strand:- start:282 stop:1643 length:1362 start_codon:yes stop_codon:yes gene_type:complete
MGFFDFLKDLDIKAPEPEPQRGMKFSSTDEKGSIATSPDGRILSNVEREAFSTRDQRRPRGEARDNINIMPSNKNLVGGQAELRSPRRDMRMEGINIMPSNKNLVGGQTELLNRVENIIAPSLLNLQNRGTNKNLLSDQVENIIGIPSLAPIVPEFDQDNEGLDPNDQRALFFADPTFPQSALFGARLKNPNELFKEQNVVSADEGSLGGNMVGTASQVPPFTTQAYTGSQPKQGVASFADAKKEIQEGKGGGIKDLNFLQKMMAVARNPIGRIMGYETDDKGMLTMKGLADMEADKKRSQAIYAEGQRQRNLDRDRAMRKAQMQQQQAPVVEEEEEEKRKFFQRNPMSMQAYLNQFRPAGMTGDVPLTMYGQLGGEYKYFMSDGGTSNVPRGNTGEVTGAGGPKDDLVGPFMLSNKEYVLPNEQIKMYGGGNYETGVKRLERDRMNALRNFA